MGVSRGIAKLDRRSRNAAFLLTLRDSGARFLAVGIMAWWLNRTARRSHGVAKKRCASERPAVTRNLEGRMFQERKSLWITRAARHSHLTDEGGRQEIHFGAQSLHRHWHLDPLRRSFRQVAPIGCGALTAIFLGRIWVTIRLTAPGISDPGWRHYLDHVASRGNS